MAKNHQFRLLTITHYSALLGANKSLLHLIEGLRARQGVEVLVLCPNEGPFTKELEKRNIPFLVRPFANWSYTIRSSKLFYFPLLWRSFCKKTLPEIVKITRQFNPDAIHSNSSVVSLGWQLAEAIDKPHIWHLREFGWSDYNLVFPFGRKLLKEKIASAAAVLCISQAIKNALAPNLVKTTHIVYNGIGTRQTLEKRFVTGKNRNNDRFRFLIIGQLQRSKRQHEAVAAFARINRQFPQTRLVVAGTGQRLYALRLKLSAWFLGISNSVQFTGYVKDTSPLYLTSDVLLMCSRHEGMGRVTAEAMSYGKPVIGFAGGATPELIQDGENGFLYRSFDELVERMIELIENEPLRKLLGVKGYENALANFTDEQYVDKIFRILQEIVNKSNAQEPSS